MATSSLDESQTMGSMSAAGSEAAAPGDDLLSSVYKGDAAALRAGVDASKKVFWSKVFNAGMTALGTGLLAAAAITMGAFGGLAIAAVAVSAVYFVKAAADAGISYALYANLKAAEAGKDPPYPRLDARFREMAEKSDSGTAQANLQDSFALLLSTMGVSPGKANGLALAFDALLGISAGFLAGYSLGGVAGAFSTLGPLVIRSALSICINSMDAKRQQSNEDLVRQLSLQTKTLYGEWAKARDDLLGPLRVARDNALASIANPDEKKDLAARYEKIEAQIRSEFNSIADGFNTSVGRAPAAASFDGVVADAQSQVEVERPGAGDVAIMFGSEHLSRLPEMLQFIPAYGGPALLMNAVMMVRTVGAWGALSDTRRANEQRLATVSSAVDEAKQRAQALSDQFLQQSTEGLGREYAQLMGRTEPTQAELAMMVMSGQMA